MGNHEDWQRRSDEWVASMHASRKRKEERFAKRDSANILEENGKAPPVSSTKT